ncbi:MAG TPA: PIG-L family deacetylase [Myxococcota bacterium]|nr:PIG-L family deacetylase [Myxococcota bacterium]HNZ02681.1 PIG-L family deacetylase [Myxococcota bacterium]HOD06708.1 PIG-L family deacetylase [Myxococcota bacterium]HPB50030.1 PIG-L family deacetylase [Myxococcota bacterium]HQP94598.1 PIG-L family deacetylase [Myxococcota bacterium]
MKISTPGPAPDWLFDGSRRGMVILAHQDDEATFGGIVSRLPADTAFLWVTNGDGLSDQFGMPDAEYAARRQKETIAAMEIAGFGPERLTFLGAGEKDIYARLASLDDPNPTWSRAAVMTFFKDLAARVRAEVLSVRPDFIITQAWQGGHPEHDLTHLMAVLAARQLPDCQVFEVPEYELYYTVFLRFPPWHKGIVHEACLTPDEVAIKKKMLDCYETQRSGLTLSMLLVAAGNAGAMAWSLATRHRFQRLGIEAREHIGQVSPNRNYRTPPHGLDRLEYIGDDWKKKRISFSRMIVPVVCALEQ